MISPIYDGTSTEVIVTSGGEVSLLRENFLLPLTLWGGLPGSCCSGTDNFHDFQYELALLSGFIG